MLILTQILPLERALSFFLTCCLIHVIMFDGSTAVQSSRPNRHNLSKEGDDIMSSGDSPYDYVPVGFRPTLDEAMSRVPEARRKFDKGEVVSAENALTEAGFGDVASTLDLYMPHKYSR
jgi:hypothetical protein